MEARNGAEDVLARQCRTAAKARMTKGAQPPTPRAAAPLETIRVGWGWLPPNPAFLPPTIHPNNLRIPNVFIDSV
jgi:hypothetical protein